MKLWKAVRLSVALAAIVACLGASCSGGGGIPIDPGDVTPEVRVQVMNAIKARLQDLLASPTSEEMLAVAAAAIADHPEFETTGSSAELGIAWGRFPGGTTYCIVTP